MPSISRINKQFFKIKSFATSILWQQSIIIGSYKFQICISISFKWVNWRNIRKNKSLTDVFEFRSSSSSLSKLPSLQRRGCGGSRRADSGNLRNSIFIVSEREYNKIETKNFKLCSFLFLLLFGNVDLFWKWV